MMWKGQKMCLRTRIYFVSFLLLFMLAGIFFLPFTSRAESAKETGTVGMDVLYGFGNTAKSDRYLRVSVALDNQGETDFSGNIEILTTQSSREIYQYSYPVSVSAGTEEKREYYVPLGIDADQMFVSLTNSSGREIVKKRLKLNMSQDNTESFVGVLSDNPEALSYMDDAGIYYGSIRTKLVYLDRATAPENALGYDQLDLVIISDFNLDSLSDQQYAALGQWVDDGGVILFGGGERYRDNMGKFAQDILDYPLTQAQLTEVDLSAERSQDQTVQTTLMIPCVDLNIRNGSSLMQGESFPLLSYVNRGKGRIAAAAFALDDIAEFCRNTPSFTEKLYTMAVGEKKVSELSQEEFFGFSGQYFNLQSLINTGDAGRLPNVLLYTIVIVIYLVLLGPVIYLFLKKRGVHRYYLAGVTACALVFTGIIYIMGLKTRFREPFFTYATIIDTSREEVTEDTYINVRSPYNKPYSVKIKPEYEIRPVTKSYYYQAVTAPDFTGNEDYRTGLQFYEDRTEIRIRDTVAFTPKLFTLKRRFAQTEKMGLEGEVTLYDGSVSGHLVNHFDMALEGAVLLTYGKAILLGDLQPGQEIVLDGCEVLNYPLSYSYVLAQAATGGDQYTKVDVTDKGYLRSQERSRLMSFYLNSEMADYTSKARVVAFSPDKNQKIFLAADAQVTEGLTMIVQEIDLNRKKDGLVYRNVLGQKPNVISGNYNAQTNTMYSSEPVEAAIIEYSLGNDLIIERVNFETLSRQFVENAQYPYLKAFSGSMYFYNYDTGRNDLVELKESFTAEELKPYLSPSNTLTVKYVSEGDGTYGFENHLPMLYVIGREK